MTSFKYQPFPTYKNPWRLFLDDERYPVSPDWTIARHSYDAQYFVTTFGMPIHMALDHDLGGDDTARVFLNWLEEKLLSGEAVFPEGFTYSVHSQNPIGAKWLDLKMKDLLTYFT